MNQWLKLAALLMRWTISLHYESLAGGTVTALQDVSRGLQEQNERIGQLTESLRRQNGHTATDPAVIENKTERSTS